ncbi:hypothetical protein C8J55DRAFT_517430 [Lentinula edodes]|uniref:Uncharacterized protein n=1 Tax=Lentinula lateritia TaxID=40482 RepID=A0A9W9DL96_9AGAR|nr:hypothetical protein C8J55DRAFT_531266 [Lentinula edodes]KAJ4476063.1 hypothetical protein C8J55DRAFT_517430 [Lentinula edodes]
MKPEVLPATLYIHLHPEIPFSRPLLKQPLIQTKHISLILLTHPSKSPTAPLSYRPVLIHLSLLTRRPQRKRQS